MSMFHSGDLQSGISLAIQEQKLVACFVRQDDDYWSEVWESDWLANDESGEEASGTTTSIAETMRSKAVLLRIEHGSQEAGFLSAFCPIEKVPTLVVIKNGTVVDKLEGGVEREEWTEQLMRALGVGQQAEQKTAQQTEEADAISAASHPSNDTPDDTSTQPGSSNSPPDSSETPANVQTLLADRGRRLETTRLRREAEEKQARMARAREIREEADRAAAASDKGKQREASSPERAKQKARVDWVQQQAKRKREAAEEKGRILARIEADKAERRRRDGERREVAKGMAAEEMPAARKPAAATSVLRSSTCALQVRLFDGSSLKSRFAADATLGTSVRTWIKETSPEGGADIPYSFRLMQMPAPSRTIGESEEGKALADVEGLMPTATLVLVPVQGYTDAYSGGGGIVGSAMGLASSAFGYLGSGLGYLTGVGRGAAGGGGEGGLYMGGTSDEGEESNVRGARMANADTGTGDGSVKPRVKTLADQRAEAANKGENEFYNGNSLGFEGRKDD